MNNAIKNQIEELNDLKLPALQARYAEVLGEETRAPNKTFLIRRIVGALESQAAREETLEETSASEQTENEETATAVENDQDETKSEDREQAGDLSIDQLRERYREVVGRETGSQDRRYLMWKIRQAEQGRIPVGPVRTRRGDGVERNYKVLPVRMESEIVEKLDEAWKRQGLKSRMELFRVSLRDYLRGVGEDEVANIVVP